jgi:hypothetical protein
MSSEIIPFQEPRFLAGLAAMPPTVFLPNEKAGERFYGFFTTNIRNENTRRVYYKLPADSRNGAMALGC